MGTDMTDKPRRYGQPWDYNEDKQLAEEFKNGLSVQEMADRHERNINGILSRLRLKNMVVQIGTIDYKIGAPFYDYRDPEKYISAGSVSDIPPEYEQYESADRGGSDGAGGTGEL